MILIDSQNEREFMNEMQRPHESVQHLNVKINLVVGSLNAGLQYTKIDRSKFIGRRLKIEKGLLPSSDWLGGSGSIL